MRKRSWMEVRRKNNWVKIAAVILVVLAIGGTIFWAKLQKNTAKKPQLSQKSESLKSKKESAKTARIMAHGDLLYHDILYWSAQKAGGYDFSENFEFSKSWTKQADLAIADFEGTINPNRSLGGYPLFNAPQSVVEAIKDAGYDVVDLAHNHILDSGFEGIASTVAAFQDKKIDCVGVFAKNPRSNSQILVKNINGIKIVILAYAYGFNGLESALTAEQRNNFLSDFDEDRMKQEIQAAEKIADITIVMPQSGNEYQLEPTENQRSLYRKMIEWGADAVLGGHPHVPEPAEIIDKDGEKKLIVYSMGNFISNQRVETMSGVVNAKWTERGVLMDLTIEKSGGKTQIKTAKAHPTWVSKIPKGSRASNGFPQYLYQTYILEDFIEGRKHRYRLDEKTKIRVDNAYKETNELINLKWNHHGVE